MTIFRQAVKKIVPLRPSILLMTATIAPLSDTFLLERKDPTMRLDDYINSLIFYAKLLLNGVFKKIVFVENSGYSLDKLINTAKSLGIIDNIEFISYVSTISSHNSRYYLEINLLIQSYLHSKTIESMENALIWKVTGRYIIKNLKDIVKNSPRDLDLYINCRNLPYRTVDFYLVAYTNCGFEEILRPNLDEFQTTRNGEDILRERLDRSYPDINIVRRFRQTPRIIGIRGFDGARYGDWRDTSKFYFRVAMNHVCPKLWL